MMIAVLKVVNPGELQTGSQVKIRVIRIKE